MMIASMGGTHRYILTVNAGSSSIKLALFAQTPTNTDPTRLFDVTTTNIGQKSSVLTVQASGQEKTSRDIQASNHSAAIALMIQQLVTRIDTAEIKVVGHRVVYGGNQFYQPTLITNEVASQLGEFVNFDPEHAPASLAIIALLRQDLPQAQHVACFDTSYFHDLPKVAQLVAIPRRYQAIGVRRYGYHGLSYRYLTKRFQDIAGEAAVNGRVIYAHLGSGVSLAATVNGEPTETTMGFSPTSGVVMSSRSGDVDPSLARFLTKETGMSIDEYNHMLNFESGLLGVSGLSSDMYTLLQNEATNPAAAAAVELFCYQVRKSIGALATTIGGIDSLVFSGGIGEQAPLIRARICEGLEFLGISLDPVLNSEHRELISSRGSAVGVHIIPTDEATIIAQDATTIASLNQGTY